MATKPLNGSITPVNTVAGGVTKGWTPANYVGIDTTTARIVIDNTTQAVAVGVLRTPGILTITNGNGTFAFDGATDVDILDSLKNLTLTVSGQSYIYNGWTDTNIDFDIIFNTVYGKLAADNTWTGTNTFTGINTFTGNTIFEGTAALAADPTLALEATTKQYVDTADTAIRNYATHMISATWAELVNLRDTAMLVPGVYYRITDYSTVVHAGGALTYSIRSAGHTFDIIVLALKANLISETAFACLHEGDTYFSESNIKKWQLKYRLDNDTTAFAWASATGKGVIYHFIDELSNECYYDFKNIEYNISSVWTPTFADSTCTGNVIQNSYTAWSSSLKLPANTFGAGCVGNILINSTNIKLGGGCTGNYFGNSCFGILLGNNCVANFFTSNVKSSTLATNCSNNVFDPDVSTTSLGTECTGNHLCSDIDGISMGVRCKNNYIGPESSGLQIGDYFQNIFVTGQSKYFRLTNTSSIVKRYLNFELGFGVGPNGGSYIELYDAAMLDKSYPINFTKDTAGRYLMLWRDTTGNLVGKVKETGESPWTDFVNVLDGGTF